MIIIFVSNTNQQSVGETSCARARCPRQSGIVMKILIFNACYVCLLADGVCTSYSTRSSPLLPPVRRSSTVSNRWTYERARAGWSPPLERGALRTGIRRRRSAIFMCSPPRYTRSPPVFYVQDWCAEGIYETDFRSTLYDTILLPTIVVNVDLWPKSVRRFVENSVVRVVRPQ